MATIIPFGVKNVGNATVTLLSFFTANEFDTAKGDTAVHKVFVQADPANTVQVDIKYGGKVIATLWKPDTAGPLPEHYLTADENVANSVDISQITLTSADAGSDVCGYVTRT